MDESRTVDVQPAEDRAMAVAEAARRLNVLFPRLRALTFPHWSEHARMLGMSQEDIEDIPGASNLGSLAMITDRKAATGDARRLFARSRLPPIRAYTHSALRYGLPCVGCLK